jgi:hypothetical protein
MQGKSKDPLMAPLNMEDMMSGFETFYLIGAIAAFAAFAITVAYASSTSHS